MKRFANNAALMVVVLISACGPGKIFGPTIPPTATSSQTPTGTASPTATPTSTETPSPTPKPDWQKDLETQDQEEDYFNVVNGQPVIDLYNTADLTERIGLDPESVETIAVNDPVRPDITTVTAAKDMEGNLYLFNPDHGWFPLTLGIAPIEKFSLVSRADFPIILAYLRSRPSLVGSPDLPMLPGNHRVNNPSEGYSYFSIQCDRSCEFAASVKMQEQGDEPHIMIIEALMENGERGYVSTWIYGLKEKNDPKYIPFYAQFSGNKRFFFAFVASHDTIDKSSYYYYLFQQPGYLDAIDTFIATDIIPPELETMILPLFQSSFLPDN